jgi:hypothetical protein
MDTSSGEIASVVAVISLVLSSLGITGVDSTVLNGAVNGVLAFIGIGAAVWSWYQHRKAVVPTVSQ